MSEKDLSKTTKGTSEKNENLNVGQDAPIFSSPMFSNQFVKTFKPGLSTLKPLYEIYNSLSQNIENRGKTPKHQIGLAELDYTLWGLHKQELLMVGGMTSHGKSSFVIQLVKNLVDEHRRIIYFSLEMSKEQILERLLSNFCELNNLSLRDGTAKEEWRKKEEVFKAWIRKLNLLIDDGNGYDFNNLVEVCKMIKPDFIIIDYIQMISSKGFRSKMEAIEEYVRKIKELSITMNFGTIMVSQFNRAGGDDPGMQNFKGTSVLEQHPDTCLILKWENKEIFTGDPNFEVKVAKQRQGGTNDKIPLVFIPQYSMFRDPGDDNHRFQKKPWELRQ